MLGPGSQSTYWARLAELRTPALLIAGEEDSECAAVAREMGKKIPGAAVELLPGVGHTPHLEAPEEYARRLVRFWSLR